METKWTPEQQKEHRKLWVEALRSGKYQQGNAVLKSPSGAMCCLGVACEISGVLPWASEPVGTGSTTGFELVGPERKYGRFYAPRPVIEWLGLADDAGSFGDRRDCLAGMNDDGAPFTAIADIIEREPDGLVTKATANV